MIELLFKYESTLIIRYHYNTNLPLLTSCHGVDITEFIGSLYKCDIEPKNLNPSRR